jgi:hypothetical protein
MLDFLFGNDQQEAAERMSQEEMEDWRRYLDDVMKSKSEFGDVNNLTDVGSKFGLTSDLDAVYRPRRRSLSTGLSRNRSAMASRTGDSAATPEAGFQALEGGYLDALSNLEGDQAEQEVGAQRFNADFLRDILGRKESFGQNKFGLRSGGIGGLGGARDKFVASQPSGSFFGDLTSIAGLVSGIPGGWEWIGGLLKGGGGKKSNYQTPGRRGEYDQG